ncbi:MAG: sulfotransferase, partial [Pseudomonadota bacterium]
AWRRYPDMKLILTHRADMDLWFQSLVKHNDRHAADAYSFRSLIYGTEDLRDKKDHAIATHEAHIAEVRRFASENDVPLIELCWENGDGWEQLCHFLGTDVPNQPFPHANAAPKVSLLKRAIKGVVE